MAVKTKRDEYRKKLGEIDLRELPRDGDLEMKTITALMILPDRQRYCRALTPEDFVDPLHQWMLGHLRRAGRSDGWIESMDADLPQPHVEDSAALTKCVAGMFHAACPWWKDINRYVVKLKQWTVVRNRWRKLRADANELRSMISEVMETRW